MAHGEAVMPLPMALPPHNAAFPGAVLPPFNGIPGESFPPPLLSSGGLSRSVNSATPMASSPSKTSVLDERAATNHIGLPTNISTASVNSFPSNSMSTLLPPNRGQAIAQASGSVVAPVDSLPPPPAAAVSSLMSHVPSLIESNKRPDAVDQGRLRPVSPPPCSKEKEEYMASLGLITKKVCKEIKERRLQRKRRRVAPYSVDLAEHEARRLLELKEARSKAKTNGRHLAPLSAVHLTAREKVSALRSSGVVLNEREPSLSLSIKVTQEAGCQTDSDGHARKRKRQLLFVTSDEHDCLCEVCDQPGELLLCDTCTKAFHFACLPTQLPDLPQGMWICPQCQTDASASEPRAWPGTISLVRSFTKYDEEREAQRLLLEDGLRAKRTERDRLNADLAELTRLISNKMDRLAGKDKSSAQVTAPGAAQEAGLLQLVKTVKTEFANAIV